MNLSDTKAGEWSASIINLMESMNMNRTAGEEGERFDLNLLWQVIRQNRARADMRQQSSISTDTWYMVIIQVSGTSCDTLYQLTIIAVHSPGVSPRHLPPAGADLALPVSRLLPLRFSASITRGRGCLEAGPGLAAQLQQGRPVLRGCAGV